MAGKTEFLLPKNEWRYFIASDGNDCRIAVVNRHWVGAGGYEYEVAPVSFPLGELPNDVVSADDMKALGISFAKVNGRAIFEREITNQ